MSITDTLRKRIEFYGGVKGDNRLDVDKLHALRKAINLSYQSQTMVLSDGKEFRCLINPDKLKGDYDNKILSVPFKDVQVGGTGASEVSNQTPSMIDKMVTIDINPGDVFTWKENSTHWLVYMKYLEETAYFRADIRRCDQQVLVGDTKYWAYIRGPAETTMQWNQKGGVEWNDMNYSLVMYITKDENTLKNLHRYETIKVYEDDSENATRKTWKVVAVNPYYGDGIISVALDEANENSIQEAVDAERAEKAAAAEETILADIRIDGDDVMSAFGSATYTLVGLTEFTGSWIVSTNGTELDLGVSTKSVTIDDKYGKPRKIILIYRRDNETDITKTIMIKPF